MVRGNYNNITDLDDNVARGSARQVGADNN